MGRMKRIGETKIYTCKNGYTTTTYTKTKVNNKTIWRKAGGSPKRAKKF